MVPITLGDLYRVRNELYKLCTGKLETYINRTHTSQGCFFLTTVDMESTAGDTEHTLNDDIGTLLEEERVLQSLLDSLDVEVLTAPRDRETYLAAQELLTAVG